MRSTIALVLALVLSQVPRLAAAQTFSSTETDCSDLQLYAAKGVPNGAVHGYSFRGVCREIGRAGDKSWVRWEGWIQIEAKYDAKTGTLSEGASVTSSGHSVSIPSGTVALSLKCAQDPMLNPSATCTIIQSSAKVAWPDFVGAWKKGAPFTKGKVTLALASSLSAQGSSGNPPPPPPAPKSSSPTLQDVGKAIAAAKSADAVTSDGPARTAVAAPPPSASRAAEIPLVSDARVALRDGRVVAAQPLEGSLRWMMLDAKSVVLRTFPTGTRVFRKDGQILIDWGEGTYEAGPEQPARRLALPRRGGT